MSRSKSAIKASLGSLLISISVFAIATPAGATTIVDQKVVAATETAKAVESVAVAKPIGTWITTQKYPSPYRSLFGISNAVYSNPGYWPGICQYNKLANCNQLGVGQQIFVPTSPVVSSVPATAPVTKPVIKATTTVASANTSRAQRIVNYALAQVGKRYSWAAAGPYAFDCSGLVMMSLAQVGINVPHQDAQILYSNQGVRVSRNNLQPGDIVWPFIGHVFVYIGNGKIVEAAGYKQGVIINNLYSFYAAKRFV